MFEYLAPSSLEEVLSFKKRYGREGRILAGGTELLVNFRQKAVSPSYLIDLKEIADLDFIEYNKKNGLEIGALARLHDIGKDLVGMMLEGAGFRVINLGVEVTAKAFAEAVRKHKPDILAMSALLTTTMVRMPEVISELEKAGLRSQVKLLVGGAPVTQAYADEIGADAYAEDAAAAGRVAASLL